MFSALKKLVGSEPGQLREKTIPAGLQSMNQSLQRRFAKGVQYNMKIVIRGDRNTGKSTLWYRLQGKKFVEEYIPTQEIQVTSIHWNYKTTDDVVKVEVWDVVDKGKGKRRGDNLKLENEPQESDEVALDAEFLDVYKNCNGVIMMFDITKQWTFNYILKELPKVPTHVPVCVLGNHRDMGEHRVILPDDIREFIAGLNRPMGSSYIHYAESSMKNGFGLKYLHRFFNIPFLQLQRETLLRQLETNQLDMDATLEELSVQQETEDQNYEIFLENVESRSKGFASPGPANGQSPSSGSQSPIVPPSGASTGSSSPSTPQPPMAPQALPQSPSVCAPSPPPPAAVVGGAASPTAELKAPAQSPEHQQLAASSGGSAPQKRSFMSRWFGSSPAAEAPAGAPDDPPAPVGPAKVQSVDDFVPDERLDRGFLEDSVPSKGKVSQPAPAPAADSDSDGEIRGNPMVSGFQDELDPDDTEPSLPQPKTLPPSKDITLTSDEEEGEQVAPTVTQDQDLDSEPELKAYVSHFICCLLYFIVNADSAFFSDLVSFYLVRLIHFFAVLLLCYTLIHQTNQLIQEMGAMTFSHFQYIYIYLQIEKVRLRSLQILILCSSCILLQHTHFVCQLVLWGIFLFTMSSFCFFYTFFLSSYASLSAYASFFIFFGLFCFFMCLYVPFLFHYAYFQSLCPFYHLYSYASCLFVVFASFCIFFLSHYASFHLRVSSSSYYSSSSNISSNVESSVIQFTFSFFSKVIQRSAFTKFF
uniref:RAB, member RAS oncogene family-like 6b n=1 Tax=Kryptolebias marmoratus TaxID=37003 RepID=A0A3Q3ACZ5_KRYMA